MPTMLLCGGRPKGLCKDDYFFFCHEYHTTVMSKYLPFVRKSTFNKVKQQLKECHSDLGHAKKHLAKGQGLVD